MSADAKESAFQRDIINDLLTHGWQLGTPTDYNRTHALYTSDALAYVKTTQPKTWDKYTTLYPTNPEQAFIDKLAAQLAKADPQATDKSLRTYGTLGVLRHELRDKSASFKLCQFKPEHGLNPQTQAMYAGNILRVVPELVYSPYATAAHLAKTGTKAKAYRIDLVLFLNGIPIVTLELKSEFKQAVQSAIRQYRTTRLPKDPETNKPEPLLTFKRGALVHFAVSQYEAHMATRLDGAETRFLPFNRGTADGGAGNDPPADINTYATAYLWNEVLAPATILQIIGRFIHLEIKTEEAWDGRKTKKQNLIGRPYLPSLWKRIPAGPPFKPCVRFSPTRLTRRILSRRITQPPGSALCLVGDTGRGVRRSSHSSNSSTRLVVDGAPSACTESSSTAARRSYRAR